VIAKLAAELGCDLIVMGGHGRGGIAGLVMGSVANRVLHLASVSGAVGQVSEGGGATSERRFKQSCRVCD
jgi:hypothetical protein